MSEKDELESDYGDAEDFGSDNDDPNVFRIREELPLPSASVHTTASLHRMIHEGHVDLNPDYQREVVWTESKQMALIESLFRNYYIPPVLFLITQDRDDANEIIRVCMDGKQRLTSIQKFFDGQIPYKDAITKKKYWYTSPKSQAGSNRLLIPEKYKRAFANKQITCVEYQGIGEAVERDIFRRVQMGVSLTGAEKLMAIASKYTEWVHQLEQKYVCPRDENDGLSQMIAWDTKRGRDFQCLAQLLYCCEYLPARTAPGMQKLEAYLSRVDPPIAQFKKEIENVMSSFWNIAAEDELKLPFTKVAKRVAPIEFVFTGVLLYVMKDATEKEQSDAILAMRNDVRSKHKDVRANNRVIGTLWDFVESLRPDLVTAKNGTTNASKKRRRSKNDDEYRPTPVKSLGNAPATRSRATKS